MKFVLQLIPGSEQYVILDQEKNQNFLFLATSGFGTSTEELKLAKQVVDFLNTLPREEREEGI